MELEKLLIFHIRMGWVHSVNTQGGDPTTPTYFGGGSTSPKMQKWAGRTTHWLFLNFLFIYFICFFVF
jgi:hypothetical protein